MHETGNPGMADPTLSPEPISSSSKAEHRRMIAAAAIGNLLEWYNFFAYGVLATTLAKVFFPAQSQLTSLLLALVTYGGGLVMRPIGAIAIGLYADRVGRRAALCLAMTLMGLGTVIIALTPGHATIGVAAPLLVVFARLLQGFSGAGELGSATSLLIENAPPHRRAVYTSLNEVGAQLGFLLAALAVLIVTFTMTPAELEAGGWRIPFMLGSVIVPLAIYIRFRIDEPELFLKKRGAQAPIRAVSLLGTVWKILIGSGLLLLYVVAGNTLFVYMPTFAARELELPASQALLSTVVAVCAMAACTSMAAAASDRFGRKPLLLLAAAGFLLLAYPGLVVLTTWPSLASLMLVQTGFAVLTAVYVGPLMTTLAEQFPTRGRATSVSFANSLTVMVGTLSPALATWLIAATGDARAPAFIVTAAAVCSSLMLFWIHDRYRDSLQ
jgi:MHS family proline/betaine transporter-like MFS transporter